MKVLFICGSLEPGRDGVGDYVRRLGAALVRMGHAVAAVALFDGHVGKFTKEIQSAEGVEFDVLRVPVGVSPVEADFWVGDFVSVKNPDWVSLQFVAYAFHPKGLPFLLRGRLAPLVEGRNFQVMFHELWLDAPTNFKQKISAVLQRMLIRRLIRKLDPQLVQVSILFNQERLAGMGINSEVLDLFGNIFPEGQGAVPDPAGSREKKAALSVLYFGHPPKGRFKFVFLERFAEFCSACPRKVRLLLACGDVMAKQDLCELLSPHLEKNGHEILDCGFLSVPALSKLMLDCDAGISKSAPFLLMKSGAAVAMLEHGLPLWLPSWTGRDALPVSFRKELVFADLGAALSAQKLSYQPQLYVVASEFMDQLSRSMLKKGEQV